MKFSTIFLSVILLCAFAAALTGCNGASQQSTVTPAVSQSIAAAPVHSWMMPDAKKSDLIYVTDAVKKNVFVYSYPNLTLVGALSGFEGPASACADAAGDVYITDDGGQIFEYAHGSGTPLVVLNNLPGAIPFACAVDPTTGNLAVTNTEHQNPEGPGSVSIFQGARGTPTNYNEMGLYFYYYAAYDAGGNLFFDSDGQACCFQFNEIAAGQTRIRGSELAGWPYPYGSNGSVAWDGKYIVVGDHRSNLIYRYQIAGSSVAPSTVQLTNGLDIGQFAFRFSGSGKEASATELIGAQCTMNTNAVVVWSYPKGGAPKELIAGQGCPDGIAFSPADP